MSDIEIARQANKQKIIDLARDKLDIDADALEPYGRFKAKLELGYIEGIRGRDDGKLILVTGISPTPPGEGKTTTSVGLGDALNRIGARAMVCIREPSLGPCFGMKGGAAGGGYAQVVPMEDINLHFTGDFHAVGLTHNLLAALVDNHIQHGNSLDFDYRLITWKRVVDLNDRSLRKIIVGLGGTVNGHPREDGFDIVTASEVMAILCLATSLKDLKTRLGNIIVGYNHDGDAIHARDLNAHGAMTALLKDALKPNLVQTLENTPAFVHGGPFANIAHGCNSVIATQTALKLADYVVTEAGFGADLGAEKFIDIKCRKAGLKPSLVVVVATLRALKYHGGVALEALEKEDVHALARGVANLERHINNIRNHFGLPCVVAVNRFASDTEAEFGALRDKIAHHGVKVISCDHWARGGAGAEALAREVVDEIAHIPPDLHFIYDDRDTLWTKINKITGKLYGASDVIADTKIRDKIARYQASGYGHYPICIAKTQYSFSTDPLLRGAPSGHVLPIQDVYLAAGAEFLVVLCGHITTMPGLPKQPAAERIDVDERGEIVGLF